MDLQTEFREVIRSTGMTPPEMIEPGRVHRFPDGKRRNQTPKEPGAIEDLIKEIQDMEGELPEVPVAPRLFCDDATSEAMAQFMALHDECAAVMEAEGGLFEVLSGLYTGGRYNLNLVLKSWSGEATSIDRKSKDALRLVTPSLTLCLTPQPEVLRDIAGKPGFRGRGLLGRFLYCMPKSLLGSRSIKTKPIPSAVEADYRSMLLRVVETPWAKNEFGERTPYIIQLSGNAHRRWCSFAEAVEAHLQDGGEFENIRDWAGKLPGQAIRLAGLYHVAKEEKPASASLSEKTMEQALNLAATLAEHAREAFNFMGSDPVIECGKRILKWIVTEQVERFTARDALRAVRGSFPKMEQVNLGLYILEERGYIRLVETDIKRGPGRKRSPEYMVNPRCREG